MQYFGPAVNHLTDTFHQLLCKTRERKALTVFSWGIGMSVLGGILQSGIVLAIPPLGQDQTYSASDPFQFQPLGFGALTGNPAPAADFNIGGGPSAPATLLPVPLDGIPSANTPWLPGREAPAPSAPSVSPSAGIGGPFFPAPGAASPTAAPMVIVIPNANTLPPEILAWLSQYQQGNAVPTYPSSYPYQQNFYPQSTPYFPGTFQGTVPGNAFVPQPALSYPTTPYPSSAYPATYPINGFPTAPIPQVPSYGSGLTGFPSGTPTGFPAGTWPGAALPLPSAGTAADLSTAVPPVSQVPGVPQSPVIPQGQGAPPIVDVSPRRLPVGEPSLTLQGGVVLLDEEFSGRARVSGFYPISPDIALAGAVEVSEGTIFSDSELEGVNINELHLTLAPRDVPNMRFSVGQLDLTSYFDRNSFAKDALTHFFAPELQSNPALASNGLGSRTGALLNYAITDNVEARASLFSSDRSISEFDLSGFAGELGLRTGNAIIRGTYISAIDGGANDGPNEIFGLVRDDGRVGISDGDREESIGVNAEVFIPEVNMGIFGRYGRYENQDADLTADTFSGGVNFLDVFMNDDRLGLGYGRGLSNNDERRSQGEEIPDVWELFYDFRVSPNVRAGVTVQQLNEFTETVAGFRLKTEFDVVP